MDINEHIDETTRDAFEQIDAELHDAWQSAQQASQRLGRAYVEKFLTELARMVDDGEVTGLYVMVQKSDGKVYPHCVGSCDAIRMIGITQVYLAREAEKQFSNWTSGACSRRTLEGGL